MLPFSFLFYSSRLIAGGGMLGGVDGWMGWMGLMSWTNFFFSCIDQLNSVAATSFRKGSDGSGTRQYGRNGCQKFVVALARGRG